MTESQGTKILPARIESGSSWDEAQGTKNSPATRESPSLGPECDGGEVNYVCESPSLDPKCDGEEVLLCRKYFCECPQRRSCRARRTLPVTVVSSPPFAGVPGGVEACMTVLVRYASSLHGMAKLDFSPLLFLNVLPSCSRVPLHCCACLTLQYITVVLCLLTAVCHIGCACSPLQYM